MSTWNIQYDGFRGMRGFRGFGFATVQSGSRGSDVTTLQSMLSAASYPVAVDGVFGPQTLDAVKTFQLSANLPTTGIVDAATWNALQMTAGVVNSSFGPPQGVTLPASFIAPQPKKFVPSGGDTPAPVDSGGQYGPNPAPASAASAKSKFSTPEILIAAGIGLAGLFALYAASRAGKASMAGYRRSRRSRR